MQHRAVRMFLYIASLLAVALLTHVFWQPSQVQAQASGQYGYLHPAEDSQYGRRFIDMRNGNIWLCTMGQTCDRLGNYPIQMIH